MAFLSAAINDEHFGRTGTYIYGFITLLCFKSSVLSLKFLLYAISLGRLLLELRVGGHAAKAFVTLRPVRRRLFGLEESLDADHLLLALVVVSRIYLGLFSIRKAMTRVLKIIGLVCHSFGFVFQRCYGWFRFVLRVVGHGIVTNLCGAESFWHPETAFSQYWRIQLRGPLQLSLSRVVFLVCIASLFVGPESGTNRLGLQTVDRFHGLY